MYRFTLLSILTCLLSLTLSAQAPVRIHVDAGERIGTAKPTFNGTNIEDLNNQTNGGVFSQLIHGEAFEENVDVDFLNLPSENYVQVYVVLDETRTPHLLSVANAYTRTTWNNLADKYDFNRRDLLDSYYAATRPTTAPDGTVRPPRPLRIGDLTFWGRFVIYDSIPAPYQKILRERIDGDEQISRHWSRIASDAQGRFTLKRGDAYMGRQDQIIEHLGGSGEVGIYNAGLYKQGIEIVEGKPYEGVLRVKSLSGAQELWLSLRDSQGRILAQRAYPLKGDGSFERVEFELTPSGTIDKLMNYEDYIYDPRVKELKEQLQEKVGRDYPDYLVACVGGGSNAAGTVYHYLDDERVKIVLAEAGGHGVDTDYTAATMHRGTTGILHGSKMLVMQTPDGQIEEAFTISAGLDYPGVGPMHCNMYQKGRSQVLAINDDEAIRAGYELTRMEGIIPAIESAHAVAALSKMQFKADDVVVLTVSGRGDKDVETYLKNKELAGEYGRF